MATLNAPELRRTESVVQEDVEWLLQKRDHVQPNNAKPLDKTGTLSPPPPKITHNEPTPPQSPVDPSAPAEHFSRDEVAPHETSAATPAPSDPPQATETKAPAASPAPSTPKPQSQPVRPSLAGPKGSNDDSKNPLKSLKSQKDTGRRSSWISSLSSKFSSTNSPQRSNSTDPQKTAPSPKASPGVEFGNPFDKTAESTKDPKDMKKKSEEPPKVTVTPRRQSVLVAAGKETKLENPGFLSSAFRRLSSSGSANMGKEANKGAICPRKIMNVDQNRDRVKISEFDQNKLRRVSFCVDVEIAGYAAQGDEEPAAETRPPLSAAGQRGSLSAPSGMTSKDAKYKEKGEGAALKNPDAVTEVKDDKGAAKVDEIAAKKLDEADANKENVSEETKDSNSEPKPDSQDKDKPPTRKKEKKKRSEAERKERKERKRKHAEQNGLVPLELTLNSDESDSSPNGTPGTSTPRTGASPTTDPLRIYKRCCQLRETTVMSRIKEQIGKTSAVLAEAPGTVAVVDLSGMQMQLADVITFGDWLAIVPVRKLVLDNCNLSDEGLRVILSGLIGCKSQEQAKLNKKLRTKITGKSGREQMGVIEKLSLKNNSQITNLGWRHIALFLHLSRSLKGIDVSGISFPRGGDLSRTTTTSSGGNTTTANGTNKSEASTLVIRAIRERLGDRLEELIMTGCDLTSSVISELVDCAIKCKICRLGLANNALDKECLSHVVRYIKSGVCEGLDLGNNNLHGNCHVVAEAIDDQNPLFAVSFSDCNLDPDDLASIMIPFQRLKNLKFIDLSHNHALFDGPTNAVPTFRKLLPKLKSLKRIHLTNCGLTSDHVIALADILPDCPAICHVSLLENDQLVNAMNSQDESAQEEACAYFASLMTATRVSETIIAIEIEVPTAESSEVVKALASQIVAYSLRNMERSTLHEFGVKMPDKDTPEVLLHLVGHMEGYDDKHDLDEPAPDDDYVIASTGIVKALGVCLGTKDGNSRTQSRNISPTGSGTATPRGGPMKGKISKQPRDVSRELCESARKIRLRLRPALVKQDKEGNDMEFRRLYMLDQTLQRMIQRFEDEYPETKVPMGVSPADKSELSSLGASMADDSVLSASVDSNHLSQIPSTEDYLEASEKNDSAYAIKLSRTSSNTSLAAKAYTDEEGRMHRFGQGMRREVLRPTGTNDYAHGTSENDTPEAAHLAKLRSTLEGFSGNEIKNRVERDGGDKALKDLGVSVKELAMLEKEDPEGFEKFKGAQLMAALNSGMGLNEARRSVGGGEVNGGS